ncbi:MAG: endonuclease V [Thermoplasmata archaeon]|nr:endonuclease V [Thermoplasmata archaeon]
MFQVPDLYEECFTLVKQIPAGMVSTYGILAKALGDEIAARAVGQMLGENQNSFLRSDLPEEKLIPCHRVVYADGRIGGFTSEKGVEDKIRLLEREGVRVQDGKVADFREKLFQDFVSSEPLKRLRGEQEKLAEKIWLEDDFTLGEFGILDVAYRGRRGYCAMVVFDLNGSQRTTFAATAEINFPYIPTYLAYRELPMILKVLEYYRPSLLLIDGNGILHPRKMGIAAHAGVVAEIPCIGAAKSLLGGQLEGEKIFIRGEHVGYKCGKYYVSPGHRVSIESARKIVERYSHLIPLAHGAAKRTAILK